MKFSDIPGHEEAKQRLRDFADSDRIPHAIILEGPEGIGKHALARAFIQYVDCRNRVDGEPCGVCTSCRLHQSMQHVDTLHCFPVVKIKSKPTISNDLIKEFTEFVAESPYMDRTLWLEKLGAPNTRPTIYVEEAQEIIRRLSFSSQISRYKSVIMWQPERLNEEAANKMLKLIEEPPGQAIFVMTSDNPMEVLPTIYSRTQRIKLLHHPDNLVAQWMVDKGLADPETAAVTAPLARGSLVEAARILERKVNNEHHLELFIKLMRDAYRRDIAALKAWAFDIAGLKREAIIDFLAYCSRQIRENFVANLHRADLNLMTDKEAAFSHNFARFVNERNVIEIDNAITQAITDIRGNANAKIVLFDFTITIILLLKQ